MGNPVPTRYTLEPLQARNATFHHQSNHALKLTGKNARLHRAPSRRRGRPPAGDSRSGQRGHRRHLRPVLRQSQMELPGRGSRSGAEHPRGALQSVQLAGTADPLRGRVHFRPDFRAHRIFLADHARNRAGTQTGRTMLYNRSIARPHPPLSCGLLALLPRRLRRPGPVRGPGNSGDTP